MTTASFVTFTPGKKKAFPKIPSKYKLEICVLDIITWSALKIESMNQNLGYKEVYQIRKT